MNLLQIGEKQTKAQSLILDLVYCIKITDVNPEGKTRRSFEILINEYLGVVNILAVRGLNKSAFSIYYFVKTIFFIFRVSVFLNFNFNLAICFEFNIFLKDLIAL